MLYWCPDLRLCYQNDTAGPACDGTTGQQSKACKQWNLYNDIKCKEIKNNQIWPAGVNQSMAPIFLLSDSSV